MKKLILRQYNEETDLQILYAHQCERNLKTLIHVLWGVSPIKPIERIQEFLREHANDPKFMIAEDPDTHAVIGWIRLDGYNRAVKHENFYFDFWGENDQIGELIRQVLETRFGKSRVRMIICEVEGYRTEALHACRAIGFKESGCIEDHVVYGEKTDLWPLYTLTMTREKWDKVKMKG